MQALPEILAAKDELRNWRRDIHAYPETAYEEFRTSDFVAKKLTEFGIDVHRGLAGTGVVGVLRAGKSAKTIALRADMDALHLDELNEFDYRSKNQGKMHACGHDGHTTMLLGAAQYLAKTRSFDGTVYFIFQPAEENEAGAKRMIDEGLFKQFPTEAVYGMHNYPGMPAGSFGVRVGPIMAAADKFWIKITGVGTHAAFPDRGVDPIFVASEIVMGLQRIVSRSTDPLDHVVVSVTQFHAGSTMNVIPETAEIAGTTRSFSEEHQNRIEQELRRVANGIASAHNAKVEIKYEKRYCPTINSAQETERAARAAASVVGEQRVDRHLKPVMGAEDFGWMLREKPGCYLFIGNGDSGAGACMCHNPRYDFNDEVLPVGASYWVNLVMQELK